MTQVTKAMDTAVTASIFSVENGKRIEQNSLGI